MTRKNKWIAKFASPMAGLFGIDRFGRLGSSVQVLSPGDKRFRSIEPVLSSGLSNVRVYFEDGSGERLASKW